MQLIWQENILFIGKTKMYFNALIKKAFIYNDTPVVLTDTIIFIEEIPFSLLDNEITLTTKITNKKENIKLKEQKNEIKNCFSEEFIYFQKENGIYYLEHKYSKPEFIMNCQMELLEVTERYLILGNGNNIYLKEKESSLTYLISFCNQKMILEKTNLDQNNSEFVFYSGRKIIKIQKFVYFYSENEIYAVNMETLETNFMRLQIYKIEKVVYDSKEYLVINNDLYEGKILVKQNIQLQPIDHSLFLSDTKFCYNFMKILRSDIEIFEKNLAKSSNPYAYLEKNVHKIADTNYKNKICKYYLSNDKESKDENQIGKIANPPNLHEYLYNFDTVILKKSKKQIFNNGETDPNKLQTNFYSFFAKNITDFDQFYDSKSLNKVYKIKENLQIRERIFNVIPNIKYPSKLSSLDFNNLNATIKEALLLCFEPHKTFAPDDSDLENKRQKISKLRRSAQSSFIIYSSLRPSFLCHGFNNSIVRILITDRSNELGMINFDENFTEDSFFNKILPKIDEKKGIYQIINQSKENHRFSSEEIAGIILGLGIRRSYFKFTNTENEFVDAMSLIASSLTNEGKNDLSILSILKKPSLIQSTAAVLSLGYSFKGSYNSFIIDILKKEANNFGSLNKHWYDEIYRLISGYSIILLHKKRIKNDFLFVKYNCDWFINLDDKLVELIVNGILFFNSNNLKIINKLKRNKNNRLEEVFYSEFFILGVKNEKVLLPSVKKGMNSYDIYKLAGVFFYVGINALFSQEKDVFLYKKLKKECLVAENEMLKDANYKFLFDTLITVLSILYNGTCDLKILKILRRNINNSMNIRRNDFINGKYEINYSLRYGDYLKYKMCIGLLFSGLGNFHLKNDCLLELIYAFYINYPLNEEDQKMFTFFRHNLISKLEIKENIIISDWDEKDKRILFDLFSKYYEKEGECNIPLSKFIP